jgi:Helix-turn-helix domain
MNCTWVHCNRKEFGTAIAILTPLTRLEASNRKERLCRIRGIALNASNPPLQLHRVRAIRPHFSFHPPHRILMSSKTVPTTETPAMPQTKLALTREEAADALGISAVTIDRLSKRGLLNPSRAIRRPLFSVSEIERFLKATQRQPQVLDKTPTKLPAGK